MQKERTLTELRKNLNGKIHVYLKDTKTAMQFLIDAEEEGFMIGNKKPTQCDTDDILALGYKSICYLGSMSRMCFQSNGGSNSEGRYHRIDYAKYKNGNENYYFDGKRNFQYD